MNSITQETAAPATSPGEAKPAQKGNRAPRRAPTAPTKAKSGNKAEAKKKAPKRAKPPAKAATARHGSKTAKVVTMLQRPGGASIKDLLKATGWQAHSVRGFLSGTVGKKMGLTVVSRKAEDGDRSYSIES